MRPSFIKIAVYRLLRVTANHDDPLLAAFTNYAKLSGRSRLLYSKRCNFANAQPGRVECFQNRTVAQAQGSLLVRRGEQFLDIFWIEEPREPPALAGRGYPDGRVAFRLAMAAKVAVHCTERGELARNRGAGVFLGMEVSEETADVGGADITPVNPTPFPLPARREGADLPHGLSAQEGGKLLEVVGIGADRCLGGSAPVSQFY